MNYTKYEIEKKIRKLMSDLEREYYENEELYIEFEKRMEILHIKKTIENCWHIGVPVHDDQFDKDEPAMVIIFFNDDTGDFECYLDCSMGRPLPNGIQLNAKGKYEFAVIPGYETVG